MPNIHYFQRYSSHENTVTNNTLQLLARIYDYSPMKASLLLTDLIGESVEIGIEINQQERGQKSVPDGAIIQRSFKILIETKVDAGIGIDQLLRHTDSFSGETQKILLLLTRESIEAGDIEDIKKKSKIGILTSYLRILPMKKFAKWSLRYSKSMNMKCKHLLKTLKDIAMMQIYSIKKGTSCE